MRKRIKALFRKFWRYLPFVCFVASVLCLCFTYGVAVGKWQVFPHDFLNKGLDTLRNFNNPKRLHFEAPARYDGKGVVVCRPEQVCPGVTLLTGYWIDGDDWRVGIRLIDLDGCILHTWQCNPRSIWTQSPHNDSTNGSMIDKTSVHGALLLPGGEVIFNLEYFGLVKLGRASEVIWKIPLRTHHSLFQDENGDIWACRVKIHDNRVATFPCFKPPFWEETVLKVSPDGFVEREISMLETIYKSGYDGLLRSFTGDALHLNDVEVLSKQKSDASVAFHAGDIMVSMHHINTVFVIDGETELIKWSLTYPFIGQHDPDFTEDGCISVFDNHMQMKLGIPESNGSRILRVDPSTREVTILYGWKESQHFFTGWCGKHQCLPNGNILITECAAGRVFEVNPKGEIVWSWIAPRRRKEFVPEITEGTRYGIEYASFLCGLGKDKK